MPYSFRFVWTIQLFILERLCKYQPNFVRCSQTDRGRPLRLSSRGGRGRPPRQNLERFRRLPWRENHRAGSLGAISPKIRTGIQRSNIFVFLKALLILYFQYIENVTKWSQGCEPGAASNTTDIPTLESSIHHHQSLYEGMCQAYTEVHSTSKKLLYQLDHLVQMCNQSQDDRKHVRLTKLLIF